VFAAGTRASLKRISTRSAFCSWRSEIERGRARRNSATACSGVLRRASEISTSSSGVETSSSAEGSSSISPDSAKREPPRQVT